MAQDDILLGDGLPAESFLDTGGRAMFEAAGACTRTGAPEGAATCAPLHREGAKVAQMNAWRLALVVVRDATTG